MVVRTKRNRADEFVQFKLYKSVTAMLRGSRTTKLVGASSLVFVLSSGVASLLHYAYVVVMGRMLGVVQFGELAVLTSLFIFASIPASGIAQLERFLGGNLTASALGAA